MKIFSDRPAATRLKLSTTWNRIKYTPYQIPTNLIKFSYI